MRCRSTVQRRRPRPERACTERLGCRCETNRINRIESITNQARARDSASASSQLQMPLERLAPGPGARRWPCIWTSGRREDEFRLASAVHGVEQWENERMRNLNEKLI